MLSVAQLFILSSVLVSMQAGPSVHNPFYCYSEDPIRQLTRLGGYYTPYEAVRAPFIDPNVSTCNPSKFWMMGRHGSRYPADTQDARLVDLYRVVNAIHRQTLINYNEGRTSLCASDIELLRNWEFRPDISAANAGNLSLTGWLEMETMAQRYQTAFPTIFPSTYSPIDYHFQSSPEPRCLESLKAFADGLFGVDGHEQVQFAETPEPDLYLYSHINCPKFTGLLNPVVRVEKRAFLEGPEYQEMIVQVSARLGFHGSNVLRASEVIHLFNYCMYDQMLNVNFSTPSAMCAPFTIANAQVIEYVEDLEGSHRLGYGQPEYRRLYENLMCSTLQDMLRFVQNNGSDHKVRVFNGHAHNIMATVTLDAFGGDDILTRHNFAQQMHRVWRSYDLLAMGANFAVIKYE